MISREFSVCFRQNTYLLLFKYLLSKLLLIFMVLSFLLFKALQDIPNWIEEVAERALGTNYGPAGGKFASRDTRQVRNKHLTTVLQEVPTATILFKIRAVALCAVLGLPRHK